MEISKDYACGCVTDDVVNLSRAISKVYDRGDRDCVKYVMRIEKK